MSDWKDSRHYNIDIIGDPMKGLDMKRDSLVKKQARKIEDLRMEIDKLNWLVGVESDCDTCHAATERIAALESENAMLERDNAALRSANQGQVLTQ